MNKFVQIALAALILIGVSFAQSVPAVDIFGGYSYLNLEVPSSGATTSQSLKLNGWDASVSVGLFRHFSAEADISGHQLNDCGGITDLKCDDFSYMFGPRYTFGDRSSKFTVFVHGLIGQDRADVLDVSGVGLSDTSVSVAAGAGFDYWFSRHIGVQIGPIDYFYTNHLNDDGAPSQNTYRAAGGIAFRFGGNFPPVEPKAPKDTTEKQESHRSWIRPWHKTPVNPSESEPTTTTAKASPRPAQRSAPPAARPTPLEPSRGMAIHSLGLVVAPQEFDGARILEVEPGSIAEMASLHVGDMIKSIDGKAVKTPMELAAEIADKSGKVRIGIQRGSVATETTILLVTH